MLLIAKGIVSRVTIWLSITCPTWRWFRQIQVANTWMFSKQVFQTNTEVSPSWFIRKTIMVTFEDMSTMRTTLNGIKERPSLVSWEPWRFLLVWFQISSLLDLERDFKLDLERDFKAGCCKNNPLFLLDCPKTIHLFSMTLGVEPCQPRVNDVSCCAWIQIISILNLICCSLLRVVVLF